MVGPDYQRPAAPVSVAFKEAAGWKAAHPQDELPKGAWWALYNDPQLDALASQVQINNQNVAQYAAQYRQALLIQNPRPAIVPLHPGQRPCAIERIRTRLCAFLPSGMRQQRS